MKSAKRNITILSLDDRLDFDEYKKFNKEKDLFIRKGFDYSAISYKNVLKGRLPKIKTEKVIIFLFFPFQYWNKNIEHKGYKGIYGNRIFYKKFMRFWRRVDRIINRHFSDKQLLIINNPILSAKCRDKQMIKNRLLQAEIPNPKQYEAAQIDDIHNLLAKGRCLFLKVRYGSMGKGITYLSPLIWETNFNFKNQEIISRRSDRGWKFRDITGNNAFLSRLIKKDIIIEKAVDTLILKRKRIDLRVYSFLKKVLYIYPKVNYPEKITTNISQGARGAPYILKYVPKHLVSEARRLAVKVSTELNLDLAGIDILLDRNHKELSVVDVNVFPGFPKRKTFNLTRAIIKTLVKMDDKGRLNFEKPCSRKY